MEGDALIQKAQGITHGTVRSLCHVAERFFFHLLLFLDHQLPQPAGDGINGYSFKIVSLAPGKDGHRDFMHFCGCKDKNNIGRRFLQRFEQGVEGPYGKHMHFVDDINLEPSFCR